MAFLDQVGNIFFGTRVHCYRPNDIYAFQIVGSTAKQPICRPVPIINNVWSAWHGGEWDARLDAAWLAANPLPDVPLRKSTAGYKSYRVQWRIASGEHGDYTGPAMIVPGSRKDYSGGGVTLKLYTPEEALDIHKQGAYCAY